MIGIAGRMVLVVLGLLLLLTYLLLRAATPDTALHERRLAALDALVLNQAALHRDVLKARTGLLRNYDPLVAGIDGMRQAAEDLRAAAAIGAGSSPWLDRLAAGLNEQEALVEIFKTRNALLQNSLTYFGHVSQRLGARAQAGSPAIAAAAATLASAMFRFIDGPSADARAAAAASLDRLARLPVSPAFAADSGALVAHGRLILSTLPVVDQVLARLVRVPTAAQARAVQEVFLEEHRIALARAGVFRLLLYVAAVMLVAYLSYLFLRLRANARALADRSGALQARSDFEHMIAGISAEFINMPSERTSDGISRALARLGRHIGMDRAYVVVAAEPARAGTHGWCREGIAMPAGWPDDVAAIGSGWKIEGYERHGCIDIPAVASLPAGPEKSALMERNIRSWLAVPLWHAGGRIGLLGFDAVEREKRQADDDIALLRTAGEIFANALARERAAQEREALESRLQQAQRMETIGTLAGGIAHDFNNILGAILGYAEMAASRLRMGSREWQHVQEVRKAGRRAQGVIDQILTFSRRTEQKRRPTRLRPVIEEAVGLLRASLPTTVAIQVRLPPEELVVLGEPTRLQQVVMNLCSNAAQAMPKGGTVDLALDGVEVAAERALSHGTLAAGRYVRLSVADSGHGMDDATLERIFEPFFTTKPAGTGTGLGLATVHGIVADHDGALHVESRPGKGSRFEAYLRRAEVAPLDDDRGEQPLPLGQGETILIVDDEKPLVLLGEEMIAALGYEPVGFSSGHQAIAAFRMDPERFDLVLADEVMPEITGTALAAALREIRPDLPILLMTGYSGPVDLRRLGATGIREVLKKPLLSADIAAAIARHLRPPDRRQRRLQL